MRAAAFFALGCLVLAGCGTRPTVTTEYHRRTLADRTPTRYYQQRSDYLQRSGAVKDRQAAESQARADAARIFGEVKPESSSSWSWGRKRTLSQGELQDALRKNPASPAER